MRQELKIFFFGDSICFGQGVSIHKGWVSKISNELEKLSILENRNFLLSNASVNGNTTRLALERMPYDIQGHKPDLILVQFGMNDCNFWDSDNGCPRVSIEAFKANLKEIVTRALLNNCKHVFLNTNHPTLRNHSKMKNSNLTYEDSNHLYNQAIRETYHELKSKNIRITLNDIEKSFTSQNVSLNELLLPDHLHLSAKGHEIYFNNIFPVVKENIKYLCSQE